MTLYTIGHSNHPIEAFLDLLRLHHIATLADVRSHPTSRWAPQFRKDPLCRSLEEAGIAYRFLGRALGGRPRGEEFYDESGHVDYARRAQAPDFQAGIDDLLALSRGGPTALMCAEEKPQRCHRRLLVTPTLAERKIEVVHIRGDGRLERDADLGGRPAQLSLFSGF